MQALPNPYNWQHHEPTVEVPRDLVKPVTEELLQGGGAVVVGGRGMGKSVLLHQVGSELGKLPDVEVLHFPSPPQSLSARECLETLADALGEPHEGRRTSHEVLEGYFRDNPVRRLVLLYDEFDRYGQPVPNAPVPGQLFFNDLETARRSFGRLGILAVGTLGVFVFRDVLGSSFLSRAARFWMAPFGRDEARLLAAPFADRGTSLADEVMETLQLTSGGIPALLTYAFQQLWPRDSPVERDVAEVFTHFQDRYGEFLSDVGKAFSDPSLSRIPQRIWELVRRERGPFSRARLKEAGGVADGALRLTVADVLHLLQAAGLVRVDGSATSDDPIEVFPVAGLLGLPEVSPPAADLAERLRCDLGMLLDQLYATSIDFFRPGSEPGKKQLVPESVFSAFLALGFGLLGWQVEREAQHVAGRTDLKLRRNGSPELALVEVKIWGRRGYEQVHEQLMSYWTVDVVAGAVVMLTDTEIDDWTGVYRRKCLEPFGVDAELETPSDAAVRGRFRAVPSGKGPSGRVDHFLLRISRGR